MPKTQKKKLKWRYVNKFIQYGVHVWRADTFIIERDSSATFLFRKLKTYGIDQIGVFRKYSKVKQLSIAKKVAQMIYNG